MPSGGDKDTIPPVVVHSVPEFNARNYKGNFVSLTFDEFIISDNISSELVVSPPLKKIEVKSLSKTQTPARIAITIGRLATSAKNA